MDISEGMVGFGAALIGAVVGGVITGVYTLKATDKAINDASEKERRHEEKEVQNLLDSLHVELGTLLKFHMRRIGGIVESLQEGEILAFYYPLTQDYFTIYNSNASKIGAIKDAELRDAIVVSYNKAKKVVDGFKYNNELYIDYRDLVDAPSSQTDYAVRLDAKRKLLVEYAKIVKEDHFELKGYAETMFNLLNNRQKIA